MFIDAYHNYSELKVVYPKYTPKAVFIPKDHHYNANNKRKKGKKK